MGDGGYNNQQQQYDQNLTQSLKPDVTPIAQIVQEYELTYGLTGQILLITCLGIGIAHNAKTLGGMGKRHISKKMGWEKPMPRNRRSSDKDEINDDTGNDN
jgi:hypothetical protein